MSISVYQSSEQGFISFPKPTVIPKGWGHEEIIIDTKEYTFKILCFNAKSQGSFHFHKNKSETWRVVKGSFILKEKDLYDAYVTEKTCKVGDTIDIPPMCPHQVIAETDCEIYEVSTPHSDLDVYRIEKGDSQK